MAAIQPPIERDVTGNRPSFIAYAMTALRYAGGGLITTPTSPPRERIITLDEVSYHDQPNDCWVIIYDRIYDITSFLSQHPGGFDVLLEYAGRDASLPFRGTGHSKAAILSLEQYLIGQLPLHERIFRTAKGISLSDLPE